MNASEDRHVAGPLVAAIGPDAAALVAEWLRDVASDHALELTDGRVTSPSVAWLAEALTFYSPATDE